MWKILTWTKLSLSSYRIILWRSQWPNVTVDGHYSVKGCWEGVCYCPLLHRTSWLSVKHLLFTCHLRTPNFGVVQGVSMHHMHFSMPLLTILLLPTPCRNPLRLNSPSHPCKALTWLKSLSWLTHQRICLIPLVLGGGRLPADNRAQLSVLTTASSPPGRESPTELSKPTKEDLFLSVTF